MSFITEYFPHKLTLMETVILARLILLLLTEQYQVELVSVCI